MKNKIMERMKVMRRLREILKQEHVLKEIKIRMIDSMYLSTNGNVWM